MMMDKIISSVVSFLPPSLSSLVGLERRTPTPKRTTVALPVVGDVPADVLLFAGSSLVFTLYHWWNKNLIRGGLCVDSNEQFKPRNQKRVSALECCSSALLASLTSSLAILSSNRTRFGVATTVNLLGLGQVSTELLFFVGSAASFRVHLWLWPSRDDTVDDRKIEREAAEYAEKKTNGFRDPGLYELMDTCMEAKRSLRKVGDPEEMRKEKISDIRRADRAKPKGPLQLTDQRLQTMRNGLHEVQKKNNADTKKDAAGGNEKVPNQTEEMLAAQRSHLRSAQ